MTSILSTLQAHRIISDLGTAPAMTPSLASASRAAQRSPVAASPRSRQDDLRVCATRRVVTTSLDRAASASCPSSLSTSWTKLPRMSATMPSSSPTASRRRWIASGVSPIGASFHFRNRGLSCYPDGSGGHQGALQLADLDGFADIIIHPGAQVLLAIPGNRIRGQGHHIGPFGGPPKVMDPGGCL